jgi:hypothetical protein
MKTQFEYRRRAPHNYTSCNTHIHTHATPRRVSTSHHTSTPLRHHSSTTKPLCYTTVPVLTGKVEHGVKHEDFRTPMSTNEIPEVRRKIQDLVQLGRTDNLSRYEVWSHIESRIAKSCHVINQTKQHHRSKTIHGAQ